MEEESDCVPLARSLVIDLGKVTSIMEAPLRDAVLPLSRVRGQQVVVIRLVQGPKRRVAL